MIKVIIQARTNSSRLPGKMLLPIAGLPLAVLCARRVFDNDYETCVATSDQSSDEPLVDILEEFEIPYIRGSLDNVYQRFLDSTSDLNDDDIIVRLTGDNPFVDANFVKNIVSFHIENNGGYTRTLSPEDRLPYGMSAEVLDVKVLRKIANLELTDSHKEHVTSALFEKGIYNLFVSPLNTDLSFLRVTVDSFEDYLSAWHIFNAFDDNPAIVSWVDLINAAQRISISER